MGLGTMGFGAGSTVGSAVLTTKGDIVTFDTAQVRLGVGANGTVLKADSSDTQGIIWEAPKDSEITFTDIATNNSSTTKHGFLKKLDNTATNFMNGAGNWAVPAGASYMKLIGSETWTQTTTAEADIKTVTISAAEFTANDMLVVDMTWGAVAGGGTVDPIKLKIVSGATITGSDVNTSGSWGSVRWIVRQHLYDTTIAQFNGGLYVGGFVGATDERQNMVTTAWITATFDVTLRAAVVNQSADIMLRVYKYTGTI